MPRPAQQQVAAAADEAQLLTVGVGMLKSYQHMGIADVACVAGCTCEPRSFDLHVTEQVSGSALHVPLG